MRWREHSRRLAAEVTTEDSRWRPVVAAVPRHRLVPRWWCTPEGEPWGVWQVRDGAADPDAWARAVYRNVSLVTEVERAHADLAVDGTVLTGVPTSTSAMPSLVLRLQAGFGRGRAKVWSCPPVKRTWQVVAWSSRMMVTSLISRRAMRLRSRCGVAGSFQIAGSRRPAG